MNNLYLEECDKARQDYDKYIERIEINPTGEQSYMAGWRAAVRFLKERNHD